MIVCLPRKLVNGEIGYVMPQNADTKTVSIGDIYILICNEWNM